MFRKITLAGILILAGLSTALATSFGYTWEQPVGYIRTTSFTTAPQGFLKFCERHPDDCADTDAARLITLDARRMRELNIVNMDVNDSLFFNTDLQGRDKWEYPTDGYGDCEDYVVEKRKRLVDLGWPASSLLITLAERKNEELEAWRYHAVLIARTAQGDYVLDNDIRPAVSWDKAARLYRFTVMQTQANPRLWALVDSRTLIH